MKTERRITSARRAMIVDRDVESRAPLRRQFEMLGWDTLVTDDFLSVSMPDAGSAAEVAFVDIDQLNMGHHEVSGGLQALGSRARLYALTMAPSLYNRSSLKAAGFRGLFPKPVPSAVVAALIEQIQLNASRRRYGRLSLVLGQS